MKTIARFTVRFGHTTRAAALVMASVVAAPVAATDLVVSDNAIVNTGHHVYMRNCAVCHGAGGDGDGAYKSLLVVAPPPLTTLSKQNGGMFPFERVMEVVSGNELMPAHGARDMPIWGQQFATEAENLGLDERTLARSRLLELIAYLSFIQE